MSDPTIALTPGRMILERYRLERFLGRGGCAVVWLAFDEELRMNFALKFLLDVIASNPEAVEDLKRETRFSMRLTHPNIVRIYNFIHDVKGTTLAGITMEYMPGGTLVHRRVSANQRCFGLAELSPWVAQLCAALDYAHVKGQIIHRDLKPANLMLDESGDLQVADFGISRSISDTRTRLTNERGTSGTLAYMSPQQMMGESASPADDVYSLGATLYDLLSGKPPFFTGDIVQQVLRQTVPSIARRRVDLQVEGEPVPPDWEATIAACLSKEVEDRPRSAAEVAERLGLHVPRSLTGRTSDVRPQVQDVTTTRVMGPETSVRTAFHTSGPGTAETVVVDDRTKVTSTRVEMAPTVRVSVDAVPAAGPLTGGVPMETTYSGPQPPRKSRAPMWIGFGIALLTLTSGGLFLMMRPNPSVTQAKVTPETSKPQKQAGEALAVVQKNEQVEELAPARSAAAAAPTDDAPANPGKAVLEAPAEKAPQKENAAAAKPTTAANSPSQPTVRKESPVVRTPDPVKPETQSKSEAKTSNPPASPTVSKTQPAAPSPPPTNPTPDSRKDLGMDLNALWGGKKPSQPGGTSSGTETSLRPPETGTANPATGSAIPPAAPTPAKTETKSETSPEELMKSGFNALQGKRFEEARGIYRSIQSASPGSETAARAQCQIIESYFLEKNDDLVISETQSLLDRYSQLPMARNYAHYKRCRTYYRKGDHANALAEALKVEASSDWRDEALSIAGNSAYRAARFPEAADAFKELASRKPTVWSKDARKDLGWSYRKLGKHQEALAEFQTYLKSNPAGDNAADALWGLAISQIDLGQKDEGRQSLNDLVARFPASPRMAEAQKKLQTLQ